MCECMSLCLCEHNNKKDKSGKNLTSVYFKFSNVFLSLSFSLLESHVLSESEFHTQSFILLRSSVENKNSVS